MTNASQTPSSSPKPLKRTNQWGGTLTLREWLVEVGIWTKLKANLGAVASAVLWEAPMFACVAYEFVWIGTIPSGWGIYDADTRQFIPGVWEGVPESCILGRHRSVRRGMPIGVHVPWPTRGEVERWDHELREAIARYNPINSFRHGRFLAWPPWTFRDKDAIVQLLSHAAQSGILDGPMFTRKSESAPSFGLEWGWGAWERWRNAQATDVRTALAPLMPPELTMTLL